MEIKNNNREFFWEVLERIINGFLSTLGACLHSSMNQEPFETEAPL